MARVLYGGGITALVGSIGGWTFQANNSGEIVRNRPIQKKQVTPKQSEINADLTEHIADWQALTLVQKTAWNTYASAHDYVNKFNKTTTATGWNWFYSINFYRVLTGQAKLTAPPTYAPPSPVINYTFTLDALTIVWVFNSGFYTLNTWLLLYATSYVTKSTSIYRPPMRFIKFLDPPPLSNITITTEWETAHDIDYPPTNTPADFTIQSMIVPIEKTSMVMGAPVFYQADISLP